MLFMHLGGERMISYSILSSADDREYERTTTAVIHGYVQPRVVHYLDSLQRALAGAGVPADPLMS